MTIEDKALEAVVAGEVNVPGDIYVGRNTQSQHIAEFFYRAKTQNLLGADETPLAIFDCIILERNGRRLGGLTLHDYAVITDQHLITWGRGLNKDIVDRFPWADIELDKFGRRNMLEGVVKFYYLLKPTGQKRKINLRTQGTPTADVTVSATKPRGTAIYLDLMPAGEVSVCVEMIHYFTHSNGSAPSADGFKEHFRLDIEESQDRQSRVDFWLRPFYVDMGNGMLVEAGAVADRQSVGAQGSSMTNRSSGTASPANRSPYRNMAQGGPADRPIPAARPPRPAASAGAVQPATLPGQPINAPETAPATPDYTVTGNVPSINVGGALNTGNRPTDTLRGVSRNNDTMRGGGGGNAGATRETVSLNNSPYSGPSKLDAYEGRVTGRMTAAQSRMVEPRRNEASASRLTTPTPAVSRPAPAPAPADNDSGSRMPPARPASPPPPAGGTRLTMRNAADSPLPPATYVSPPSLPIQKDREVSDDVLGEMAEVEAQRLGRPLVVPIAVAIPRGLLNAYSISRLARGLWIDPRNLGRNLTDISSTLGVVGDLTELLTDDDVAREASLRRLKIDANTSFGDNIIFHYTVWPFVKPVIDALNLPGSTRRGRAATRRVSVRQIEDDMVAREGTRTPTGSPDLPNVGPMAGRVQPAASVAPTPAASVAPPPPPPTPAASVAPPTPASAPIPPPSPSTPVQVKEASTAETVPVEAAKETPDAPLNTSGKASTDPTAGMNLDDTTGTQPDSKSKLG